MRSASSVNCLGKRLPSTGGGGEGASEKGVKKKTNPTFGLAGSSYLKEMGIIAKNWGIIFVNKMNKIKHPFSKGGGKRKG